jgi:hypothetical protein
MQLRLLTTAKACNPLNIRILKQASPYGLVVCGLFEPHRVLYRLSNQGYATEGVANSNLLPMAMGPTTRFSDVRASSMVKIALIKMHLLASSLDGGTSARHHVIPTIWHAVLWVGTPSKDCDNAPLVVQYGVRRPTKRGVELAYGMCSTHWTYLPSHSNISSPILTSSSSVQICPFAMGSTSLSPV